MNKSDDILYQDWDVIVIGTGMSGAACGHQLAKSGKKVLFCEKGKSHLSNQNALVGKYAEEFYSLSETNKKKKSEIFSNAGRWFNEIEERSNKKPSVFTPFAGVGTGGSSTLYGMVMQRFSPDDFKPKGNFQDAPDANLPEQWPINYDDLRPYYQEIERLFNARGEIDPLRQDYLDPIASRDSIPENAFSSELFNHFKKQKLNPYQPPLACELVEGCMHCQGFICPKNCKNDSVKVFLKPAIEKFGATLLDECPVVRLEEEQGTVKKVICRWRGKELVLRANVVILAAGALETPNILLNSKSNEWPEGLANQSGLVGKNLMRNFYDLYFIFSKSKKSLKEGPKDIYLTDFYTQEAGKLGIIQSFGHLSPKAAVDGMEVDIENSALSLILPVFRIFKPVLLWYLTKKFSSAYILVSTMEDLPYADNKIIPTTNFGDRLAFQYRIHDYDKQRINILRKKIKQILKPYKFLFLKQAEQSNNFIALACGTCRFGDNSETSVLDANNKAHGIHNLYVIDSSFFPTNPGLNSGLTVAANALRVADKILE